MPPHPSPDDLRAYLLGKADETDSAEIAAHLETCVQCEATLLTREGDSDTLLTLLRGLPEDPSREVDAHLRSLIDLLKKHAEPALPAGPHGSDDLPLTQLREYRLLAKLGEGGMGSVYKALHTRLNKLVAIKVLPREKMKSATAVVRFEREMRAVGALDHPHLIRAHDAGVVDGAHFLVMEYVAGADLSKLQNKLGPLPIPDACEIVRQAALGLEEAHRHGLVHRDIKPSNLMLNDKGQVKVLDLGLALLTEDASEYELTTTGQVMGTLDYMAPEQCGESRHIDARADIYSLGATLYKLLTGSAPFARYVSTLRKLQALATEVPPPPHSLRAEIPEALSQLVTRMLSRPPGHRPPTAQDVAVQIAPFCAAADLGRLLTAVRQSEVPTDPSLHVATVRDTSHQETKTLASPASSAVAPQTASSPSNGGLKATTANRGGRRLPPAKLLGGLCGGLALLAAIVFFVRTHHGSLRVEINDPQVTVTVAGTDIVLQQQNSDPVSLAVGKHALRVRHGDLELETSEFELKRSGETVVKVQLLPGELKVELDSGTLLGRRETGRPDSPQPNAPELDPSDPQKPVLLVRHGRLVRAFRQIAGAVAEAETGDTIEVRAPGTYQVNWEARPAEPLHIRAAGGCRPRLEIVDQRGRRTAPVTLENCDLVAPQQTCEVADASLTLHNCRVLANTLVISGQQAEFTARDSLLLLWAGVQSQCAQLASVRLENCIVRSSQSVLNLNTTPEADIELRHCTIHNEVMGGGPLLSGSEGVSARVIAEGNLIHIRGQAELLGVPNWLSSIDWRGNNNLYSGYLFAIHDGNQQFERWATIQEWTSLWSVPEKGSCLITQIEPRFARTTLATLEQLRTAVEPVVQSAAELHGLPQVGCHWDLVGPGDAYVKVLELSGRAPAELRPEAGLRGPVVLLRGGEEISSHVEIAQACEQALDGDVIELRTNSNLPAEAIEGDTSRHLTLRAGAGYSPVLEGLHTHSDDAWTLEGLTIAGGVTTGDWDGKRFTVRGGVHRLANCTVLAAGLEQAWRMVPRGDQPPRIVNSRLIRLRCAAEPGSTLVLENSVLFTLTTVPDPEQPDAIAAELHRCTFWGPEPHFSWRERLGGTYSSIYTQAKAKFVVQDCYFAPPETILSHFDYVNTTPPIDWQGQRNVFALPFRCYAAGRADAQGLDGWSQFVIQEEGSYAALPPLFDPEFWKLEPGTPGASDDPVAPNRGAAIERIGIPSSGDAPRR